MRNAFLLTLCTTFLLIGSGCQKRPATPLPEVGDADAEAGRLIAFYDSAANSAAAREFRANALPEIAGVAETLGVTLTEWDIQNGAPAEVTHTPLLVYMNHRGRSVYQGRYSTPERLRTFIRIAQRQPQTPEEISFDNAAVWREGRAEVAAILKVAPLQGTKPDGYEEEAFRDAAAEAVFSGMRLFEQETPVTVERAQRRFYFDINPWASTDGTLFLSIAVFSQFHCEEPIITNDEEKIIGPWEKREALFVRAAQEFEQRLVVELAQNTIGDGFQPVTDRVRNLSWEEMGLELPDPPPSRSKALVDVELPRAWRVLPRDAGERPSVMFQFASPLDQYVGQVQQMSGTVTFGPDNAVAGMAAAFATDNSTISMGMDDLNAVIQEGMFLGVAKFPESSFTLESFESDAESLGAAPLRGTMRGKFTLKDKTIPLTADATFEPYVGDDGAPRLDLAARFELRIDEFGLPTPDGPEPQKFTVLLDVGATLVARDAEESGDGNSDDKSLDLESNEQDEAVANDGKDDAAVPLSLLGEPLEPPTAGRSFVEQSEKLAAARAAYEANPDDLDAFIWVGRRIGYLLRMQDAIAWYTRGLEKWPDEPRLLRHRGHRYLSLRQFDKALADFERAAELIEGQPDRVEQDGLPNARNIPLTTLGFNIWYHIGVARFCKGDFAGSADAFAKTREYLSGYDDNLVAVTDWQYMSLRRLGRDDEAAALLEPIAADMDIIENDSYHKRLLMYKGEVAPGELFNPENANGVDLATQGFGVGHWHLVEGRTEEARRIFEQVVAGHSWAAFGYIAAESELARMR